MYPTKEEFKEFLRTREMDWILDHHVFSGLPFYSSDQPKVHKQVSRAISKGLNVPLSDICVVGSARIGFSLSPLRFGEPFSPFSDIDIIVVSPSLFDPSWLDILGSQSTNLGQETRNRLRQHREYHYIYNGWIYPGSVLEALEIGERWLRTFNGLSHITELAGRSIGSRLYRTWDHARLYHQWSLQKVKDSIHH